MNEALLFLFGHVFWIWFGLSGVFLIAELMSGSGWLLGPAGSAAAVGVTEIFVPMDWEWQMLMFAGIGVIATYLGRRFMPRFPRNGPDINDPMPRLIGKQGKVASAFRSGLGRVFVDGKEWAAELDGGGDLAAQTLVEVVEILGGARLKVRAA